MKRICFVTNELYPFKPGGLGRLMYNFRKRNVALGSPVEMHFLLPETPLEELSAIREELSGEAFVSACSEQTLHNHLLGELLEWEWRDQWAFERGFRISLRYMYALLELERRLGSTLDWIEFPDWNGWALATILAKRTGYAFDDALITVRLHSTAGLIMSHEPFYHHPSLWLGCIVDQERYCLQHADQVVGHAAVIADANRQHYGFDEQWRTRVLLEFPPILLDEEVEGAGDGGAAARARGEEPTFVFSSRLQPFKRPDLFVNGAIAQLQRRPAFRGRFLVAAYGWDDAYIDSIKGLVPPEFTDRIEFRTHLPKEERAELLRNSIVVVPSQYESLCLFAYEAALLGRRVILNERCLVFGGSDRWRDGENCLMFDGTFVGLADAMERALTWSPKSVVDATPDTTYWERGAELSPSARPSTGRTRRAPERRGGGTERDEAADVPVVKFGFDGPLGLSRALIAAQWSHLRSRQLVFVVNYNLLESMGEQVEAFRALGWRFEPTYGPHFRPSELHRVLLGLESPRVCLLPAGFDLHPSFLKLACRAADTTGAGVVSSHCRVVGPASERAGVRLFYGAMPSVAMLDSRAAPRACLLRADVLRRWEFDERAGQAWFEAFARSLVLGGVDVVVIPDVLIDVEHDRAQVPSSKQLSSTLYDRAGFALGCVPRLLTLDAPLHGPSGSTTRIATIEGEMWRNAQQAWPRPMDVPRAKYVAFRNESADLLIHPPPVGVSAALVPMEVEVPVFRVDATVHNRTEDNQGVEFALVVGQEPLTAQEFGRVGLGDEHTEFTATPWRRVDPLQKAELSVSIPGRLRRNPLLYVMTRVPPGCTNANACGTVARVEYHSWSGG